MTTAELIQRITEMYGDFATPGMAKAVINKVQPLADRQRDKLYDTYTRTVPGNFKPDLKAIIDCMDKAGIKVEKQRTCPACNYAWYGTMHECPRCAYTPTDGDPLAYYDEWANGKGRFNRIAIQDLLRNMQRDKAVMVDRTGTGTSNQ